MGEGKGGGWTVCNVKSPVKPLLHSRPGSSGRLS